MKFYDSNKPQWIVDAEQDFVQRKKDAREKEAAWSRSYTASMWTINEKERFMKAVRANPENAHQLLEEAKSRADKFFEDEKLIKESFSSDLESPEFYEYALEAAIHNPLIKEVEALYKPRRDYWS